MVDNENFDHANFNAFLWKKNWFATKILSEVFQQKSPVIFSNFHKKNVYILSFLRGVQDNEKYGSQLRDSESIIKGCQ